MTLKTSALVAGRWAVVVSAAVLSIAHAQTPATGSAQDRAVQIAAPAAKKPAAAADVQVQNLWVRATVPGQKGTGAFMRLTAKESTRLVGIETSASAVADVHEMKMEGDVMRMRAITGLDLPAGKAVDLLPGGYHVMLQDLKQPLPKGSSVKLTLVFAGPQGESRLTVDAPVATAAPGGAASPAAAGHGAHGAHGAGH